MKFLRSHQSQDWYENWEQAFHLLNTLSINAQREARKALDQASVDLERAYPDEAGNCPIGYYLDELAIVRQFVE